MELSKEAIWAIVIVSSGLGVLGGIIGIGATIHAAKGPNERTLAYRFAAFALFYLSAIVAGFFLIPQPYRLILHAVNLVILLQIPRGNRWFQQARVADLALSSAHPKDARPIDDLG